MSAPLEIERRIKRILTGVYRIDDFNNVFLWLRSRTYGQSHLIKDIGDLIAHKHEKNQGIFWERVFDFYNVIRFHYFSTKDANILTKKYLENAVTSSLRLMGPSEIRQKTKIPYNDARKLLVEALSKISIDSNGNIVFYEKLSEKESAIFITCFSILNIPDSIKVDDIIFDLKNLLKKHNLLHDIDVFPPDGLRDFISKSMICLLHGLILYHDDIEEDLYLRMDVLEDKIVRISAYTSYDDDTGACFPVFESDIQFDDCFSEIAKNHKSSDMLDVFFEIDSEMLISIIP